MKQKKWDFSPIFPPILLFILHKWAKTLCTLLYLTTSGVWEVSPKKGDKGPLFLIYFFDGSFREGLGATGGI